MTVNLKCLSWNVQSIRNKCAEVMEHVKDYDADVVFVSETWMQADNDVITAEIKSHGYTMKHNRRRNRDKDLWRRSWCYVEDFIVPQPNYK